MVDVGIKRHDGDACLLGLRDRTHQRVAFDRVKHDSIDLTRNAVFHQRDLPRCIRLRIKHEQFYS